VRSRTISDAVGIVVNSSGPAGVAGIGENWASVEVGTFPRPTPGSGITRTIAGVGKVVNLPDAAMFSEGTGCFVAEEATFFVVIKGAGGNYWSGLSGSSVLVDANASAEERLAMVEDASRVGDEAFDL
jgi:hypothetical protein